MTEPHFPLLKLSNLYQQGRNNYCGTFFEVFRDWTWCNSTPRVLFRLDIRSSKAISSSSHLVSRNLEAERTLPSHGSRDRGRRLKFVLVSLWVFLARFLITWISNVLSAERIRQSWNWGDAGIWKGSSRTRNAWKFGNLGRTYRRYEKYLCVLSNVALMWSS